MREVNEAIESGFAPAAEDEHVRMRCECGAPDCNSLINVRVADYEHIRENPRLFILAHGHHQPEVERIVARTVDWVVVEKVGRAGEIAERTDPRGEDEPPRA